jgi:hypothetical protein
MGERAKEAILSVVGLSFISRYQIVGLLTMSTLFLMFIWGLVMLVVTIITWAFAIYQSRGAQCWELFVVFHSS